MALNKIIKLILNTCRQPEKCGFHSKLVHVPNSLAKFSEALQVNTGIASKVCCVLIAMFTTNQNILLHFLLRYSEFNNSNPKLNDGIIVT